MPFSKPPTGLLSSFTRLKKTARKQDEQTHYLHAVLDALPHVATLACDAQHRIVYWSRASEVLYGYPAEMALGQPLEDLVCTPETRSPLLKALDEWLVGNKAVAELSLNRRDGTPTLVAIDPALLADAADGAALYLFQTDLSAQREQQRTLQQSEAAFRRIVECLPGGVVQVQGDRIWMNAAAERIIGHARSEITGLADWFSALYGDQAAAAQRQYQLDRALRFRQARQETILTADGNHRHIDITSFCDAVGEIHLLNDSTERVETEVALRLSEERYAIAVRGSSDGLWDWDIRSNTLYFSARFEALLGYEPGELGDEFAVLAEHFHPDEHDQIVAYMNNHLTLHVPFDVECRLAMRSGDYGWFRLRGEGIWDADEQPIRMAGSLSDIRDRIAAIEALKQSESRLNDAQQVAQIGNWEWHTSGDVMWWSEVMRQLHNTSARQATPSLQAFFMQLGDEGVRVRNAMEQARESHTKTTVEYRVQLGGRLVDLLLTCSPRFDSLGNLTALRGTVQDITQQKRIQRLLSSERLVLEQIAAGKSLVTTLQTLCEALERQMPGAIACAMEVDQESKQLHYLVSGDLPAEFVRQSDSWPAAPYGGSCCAAAALKRPINVANVEEDIVWRQHRDIAATHGLTAAWAYPVIAKNLRVVGVLGLYFAEAREPLAHEQDMLERMAKLAGIAIENHLIEHALRESEERWHFALEGSRDGVWDWNIEANEAFYSRQYEDILGTTDEHRLSPALGDWHQRIHSEDKPRVFDAIERCFRRDEGHYQCEYRIHRFDGHARWVMARGKVIDWNDQGQPARMIGTLRDITDTKRTEEDLLLHAKVFQGTGEGILITDRFNRIISVNDAFTKITGYSQDEVLGQNPSLLASGRHGSDFYRDQWVVLKATGYWQGEIFNRRKNGEIYPEWLTITVLRKENGDITHFIGTFSDISERKAQAEHIQFLANFDVLTQLPNRQLLKDRVDTAIAGAHRAGSKLALLFLDLDRFKNINDSLGHKVGDALLQGVAERLRATVIDNDTVSRLGGDEFAILLNDLRQGEDAAHMAQRMIDAIIQPYHVEQHELRLTPSIGIAVYPDDGTDFETLIKNADAAMYHAKDSGRNNYQFFTQNMNARVFEHLMLENNLRRALEQRQFELYYQPQYDVSKRRIVGAEALIRWRHPELGLISPARFIPVAEESGLIVPISNWVLETVCQQGKQWERLGLAPIPLSVNVSALQFRQKDFLPTVLATLAATGLPPERLALELTESMLMQNTDVAIDNMSSLKAHGIGISIDDFGTGYSSLSYLKRFPIDKLKIDQSFIRELPQDADNAAITAAIVSLAQSLHLNVIAEGVETPDQRDFLLARGCTEIQGYLFSPPVPPEQFAALLGANTL